MPLLRLGFRPFFLLGAVWAVLALALWLAALAGLATVGGPYGAVAWHAHEMVYGFAAAILGGFLLTAVPGWTMQPKLGPAGLAGLAGIRSEEHTSELQSLMRISYAVFCLKKKN